MIFAVCLSVHYGCSCDQNEFAGCVHKPSHFPREMAVILITFLRSYQLLHVIVAGYMKDASLGACNRNSDEQERKLIQCAGPE